MSRWGFKLPSLKRSDWLTIALILLACSPSFFISPKAVVRSIYPFLLMAGLFSSRRLLAWMTLPAILVLPGALYFWFTYHSPTNVTPWLIIFGTDIREGLEFIGWKWILIAGYVVVVAALFIWVLRYLRPSLTLSRRWRVGLVAVFFVPASYLPRCQSGADFYDEMIYHFTASYPWNFIMGFHAAKLEMKRYAEADFNNQWDLKVTPEIPHSTGRENETYILVLGESARRDRHSLYGYPEKTNPEMEKLKDLLVYPDVVTLHPHTVAAVPTILTKQEGFDEIAGVHPSFLQVFQQGGFKTYWLSNQAGMGGGDNRVAVYARKADFFKSFHIHNLSLPWAYDGELLALLDEKLAEPTRKKLIVLHLQGSHYGFAKRYPPSFSKFEDPYDNTILYTDWVLGQIVDRLKRHKGMGGMVYLSDHGLLLNACGKPFSHFDCKNSFEIPFWMWMNNGWREKNEKKWRSANLHRQLPLTTLYVFDTLVDMAGIRYDGFVPAMSLLNDAVAPGQRLVRTFSQTLDYDHSHDDDDCHLQPTASH
jgi:glucan phosphoethanolaminetransferase (alkaline phosphatase superfamily)